ncbi:Ig-like domain repeat protein [Granulicella arctica]|uniref:Sugar lactone lactonase YvrE n=1 Tax=Granulicella arctica TaxID=940613 RepID=A0A7Y9PDB5_9BACT|nr:Ig-like domain repeat protein [Granulicella arctica]NYF77827.1 sugar lactone lactonase YvrE [Granulicella arctica]
MTGTPWAHSSRVATLFVLLLSLASVAGLRALAQAPPVVATSTVTLAAGFSAGPAVTDACGDLYVYEGGATGIVEIEAGTGKVTTIIANAQGYNSSGTALYMDPEKKNLYFPDFSNFYTTHFDQLPITNCVPGAINDAFANNLGDLGNYYYGTVQDAAGDAAGNVYFNTSSNVTQAIYKETYSASAETYADSQILTWKNNIVFIAADAAGDVFFVDNVSQNVYELAISGTSYPDPPTILVQAAAFKTISGLSFDPLGNLYIADSGASLIFEVPLENGALNPADVFATAAVGAPYKVSVDASHNIYLSNGQGAAKLKPGSAIAPATAVGSTSATFPITYVFNAATTPESISVANGTSITAPFAIGTGATGACAVGTAQAALSSCTVNLTYTPTAVGKQTSAVTLGYSSSALMSDVFGVGQGAAATIDPGTITPSTTTLTAPSGVTVDSVGNVFVTDSTANTLTEFAAGSAGSGTTISTGTLSLSGPKGVAVDPAGNIFIADTGNNRVVEIPVVNGVLTNASAFALSPTLKAPQGVAVDGSGNLFISDTGDNNLLLIPNINGALSFAAAQSFGASLDGPTALAFDQNGDLFLAESGNNDVLEFTAPVGSAAQVQVAAGFTTPTGLATDASNSLFVVDSGSGSVVRFPNVNGVLGEKTLVGGTIFNPIGVAVDASGNLYVTDSTDSLVAEIARVTAALQFGGVNVGATGTETSQINSSGNLPLTFMTPDYTIQAASAPGFVVTGDTCIGATLAPGSACAVTATYTPTAPQLNAQENLTLSANGSNGTPIIQLIGTGAHLSPSTLTLVLTSPAGATTLNAGQSVTFTATIGTGTDTAVVGGSVEFFVNGTQVETVKVKSGSAVLTLKDGLPGGQAVVVATYTDDVIHYGSSSAQLTETVNALSDTMTLAISGATLYINPLSVNDNSANAAGPAITLTATIVPSSSVAPGGTVTFFAGSTNLGIISVVPSSSGGYVAQFATTALRAGTTNVVEDGSYLSSYNITAVYSGDNIYEGANAGAGPIYVVGPPPLSAAPVCATESTPTCHVNTTGATFTVTPTSPTITVASSTASGQVSGSATLTITSYGGWQGVLTFTCAGLPAYATCAPFPGAPVVNYSTAAVTYPQQTISFIINTNVAPLAPTASSMIWWVGGMGGLALLMVRRRIRKLGYLRAGQWMSVAGLLLLMVTSIMGVTACSSSSKTFTTPTGTSNVTVTVRGAQGIPTTTNVALQDSSVPPINITLVVK